MSYTIANKTVGKTGYGLMGFNMWGPRHTPEENIATMKTALQCGANFWNSGVFYGGFSVSGDRHTTDNLKLLGQYFEKYPEDFDKVCLSVKGGLDLEKVIADSSKERIATDLDTTFKFLPKKYLDMYCIARQDEKTGIEAAVSNIVEHIKAGTVGSYCLSEAKPETIRRAHAVYPVGAVEMEYSMFVREAEDAGVIQTCAELGIPMIAYSPLGGGILTGQFDINSLPENDARRTFDRHQPQYAELNKTLVEKVAKIAQNHGVSNAQVALEWLRLQSQKSKDYPVIIPLPGSTTDKRVKENTSRVNLTEEDVKEIEDFLETFRYTGHRYNAHADAGLLK